MPTIRLIPSAYTRSSTSRVTVTNEANMYNNTDHTGSYATIRGRNNTNNVYYAFIHGFNFEDIPEDAIVNSFSVKIKAYRSSNLSISNLPRLASTPSNNSVIANTTLSSAFTIDTAGDVYTFPNGSLTWNQVVGYGSDFSIQITLLSTASNQYPYAYVYGAEIEVNYTLPVYYNITSTLATESVDSIDPVGLVSIKEGNDYELSIYTSSINDILVFDNTDDVTSNLTYISTVNETLQFSPVEYDSINSQVSGTDTTNVPANGLTKSNSNTRAAFTTNTAANSATRIYYSFDCSSIPKNAIITSVTCSFKATCSNNYFSTRIGQLCTGTTKKGIGTTITNTSINNTVNIQQITNTGTWTREELNDIKILIEAIRNTSTNAFTISFYGATLSITYEAPSYWKYILEDVSEDHEIEVGDNSSIVRYLINTSIRTNNCSVNNSSIKQKEGTDFTLIIYYSDINNLIVTDNGNNVTSLITGSSGEYSYELTNISTNHNIIINERPWYEVTIESLYEDATVSVSANKVYEGDSFTVTVNVSNINLVNIKDNGVDATSSFTRISTGVYRASYSNTDEDHEFIVVEANAYSLTAVSNTENATISPAGMISSSEGTSKTFYLTSDINWDLIILKDNSADVTSNIVHQIQTTTNGTFIPSSLDTINSSYYSVDNPNRGLANTSSTDYARFRLIIGNAAETTVYYNFDCSSIPENAIINSVSCQVKVRIYNSPNTSSVATKQVQLYSGTTPKGAATAFTTSTTAFNISNTGTWTREELEDIKLNLYTIRGDANTNTAFYIYFYGSTLTVNYTVPENYHYTLTNINANHTIALYEVFIPEEEDENKTYYSISISSLNATTNPANGTIRIEEGENQTITIIPTESNLTLATDNGVDITDQLTGGESTYTITTQVSGASYGFELNTLTGYYVSENDGVNNSAAVARINFNMGVRSLVTIQYINYAEANYDYGMFGKVDTTVSTDGLRAGSNSSSPSDSTSNYQLAMASNSSSEQTITYTIERGEHFIDIKYGKDEATSSNNDTLQWKILSIEPLESTDITYTINNIDEDHSLIFIYGEVIYYIVAAESEGCKTYPTGDSVVLPNESYSITIIPDFNTHNILVYDNGRDITKNLEYFVTERANYYIYNIKKVTSDHTISIICTRRKSLYIRMNGEFIPAVNMWVRINDTWVQKDEISEVFDTSSEGKIYISKKV